MHPFDSQETEHAAAKPRACAASRRLVAVFVLGLFGLALPTLAGCGSGFNTAAPGDSANTANISLSANALSFGQTTVGTTANQNVTLSNTGTGSLTFLSFSLSDTKNFAVTTSCSSTLAAGASCTFIVSFQPVSTGSLNATLSVLGDAANTPQTIALSGTGVLQPLPQASLSPGTLTFSSFVGSGSTVQTVTLTNTGTATLLVSSVALSDTVNFTLNSTCGQSVAAGATCTFSIAFQPQVRGSLSASLSFTDNAGGVAGTVQHVALSGMAFPTVNAVMNFGDSITCSFYAMPNDGVGSVYSSQGYAELLDTALESKGAKSAQNLCRPGDQAADTARLWVYPNTVPPVGSHALYTMMIGTNDARICGSSAGCLTNWSTALKASLTWLALPAGDKVLGPAISTRTGTWVDDFYGIGTKAFGPGATLTIPVTQTVAGRTLYLGYRVFVGQVGSASVALDGTQVTVLNETPSTGQALGTQNGTTDTVFVAAVPLGAVGPHTVTVTTTSAVGLPFIFLWAGVSSGNYGSSLDAPRVLVGGVPTSSDATVQNNINSFNAQLSSLVAGLVADGMDVEIAPTAGALNPATDLVDAVHPNNAGHLKLEGAFLTLFP